MAVLFPQVLQILLELELSHTKLDLQNERTLWRKLFLSAILKLQLPRHFWVIDGLDECSGAGPFLELISTTGENSTPPRILFTSRAIPDIEHSFSRIPNLQCHRETLSVEDTSADIRRIVEYRARVLVVSSDDHRTDLVKRILDKAQGSFLWTGLVLSELSRAHSEDEIGRILDDVPQDMVSLYNRILSFMKETPRGAELAKAILLWVAFTTRPLTVPELQFSLEADTRDRFPNMKESITSLCGQLLVIDKAGKVQPIHETTREFLLGPDVDPAFAIHKPDAHGRIAMSCLKYLTGDEMRPPRTARRNIPSSTQKAAKHAAICDYAIANIFHHLARADPDSESLFVAVIQFLGHNILTWVERVAMSGKLGPLVSAARCLGVYLGACLSTRSPLEKDVQTIKSWTADLQRIAAKFSVTLIRSPASIHFSIVPFCPNETAISRVSASGRKMTVTGLSNTQWDDRLSCINFQQGQTSALAFGMDYFAVGLFTGNIVLYHATSCQEFKTLVHGEAVTSLDFQAEGRFLASAGLRFIIVWDLQKGQIAHRFPAPRRCLGLTFDQEALLVASSRNDISRWELSDLIPERTVTPMREDDEGSLGVPSCPTSVISMSAGHRMAAVFRPGGPVALWDLSENAWYGTCGKRLPNGETSTHVVSSLVFNPSSAIELLAISYLDGDLVIVDPFGDQEVAKEHANCHTLAASLDGRLLAGGSGFGIINLFEFDTLRLIYKVRSTNVHIKQLAFQADSQSFADLRGTQCNIWKPPALVSDDFFDDGSSIGTTNTFVEAPAHSNGPAITALAVISSSDVAICGMQSGEVTLWDLKKGCKMDRSYSHRSSISMVSWLSGGRHVLSVDLANGVQMRSLSQKGWDISDAQLTSRLETQDVITQILSCEDRKVFVLATRTSDHLWDYDGELKGTLTHPQVPEAGHWIQHPSSRDHAARITGATVDIYAWQGLSHVISHSMHSIDLSINTQLLFASSVSSGLVTRVLLSYGSPGLIAGQSLLSFSQPTSRRSTSLEKGMSTPATDQLADQHPPIEATNPLVRLFAEPPLLVAGVKHRVAHVIGVTEVGKLIFIDQGSWVCSIDLQAKVPAGLSYTRHFFIPYDWFAGSRSIVSGLNRRDLVFAVGAEIATIRGGLDLVEVINLGCG